MYGPTQDDGRSVAEVFGTTIRPPLFPIGLDDVARARSGSTTSTDDEFIDRRRARSCRGSIPHVGATLGYRVEWNGVSVAYLSDHQQPFDGGSAPATGRSSWPTASTC